MLAAIAFSLVAFDCSKQPVEINEPGSLRYVTQYDFDTYAARTYRYDTYSFNGPWRFETIDTITESCDTVIRIGDTTMLYLRYNERIATSTQGFDSAGMPIQGWSPSTAVSLDTVAMCNNSVMCNNQTGLSLLMLSLSYARQNVCSTCPVDSTNGLFNKSPLRLFNINNSFFGSYEYATGIGLLYNYEFPRGGTNFPEATSSWNLIAYNGAAFDTTQIIPAN